MKNIVFCFKSVVFCGSVLFFHADEDLCVCDEISIEENMALNFQQEGYFASIFSNMNLLNFLDDRENEYSRGDLFDDAFDDEFDGESNRPSILDYYSTQELLDLYGERIVNNRIACGISYEDISPIERIALILSLKDDIEDFNRSHNPEDIDHMQSSKVSENQIALRTSMFTHCSLLMEKDDYIKCSKIFDPDYLKKQDPDPKAIPIPKSGHKSQKWNGHNDFFGQMSPYTPINDEISRDDSTSEETSEDGLNDMNSENNDLNTKKHISLKEKCKKFFRSLFKRKIK